ncbi:hypothetical protein CLW00_11461 [Mongoliibacter ruber]|uniref:Uncharacterized protein n=1 Tax=Mongoliibacter ruber TaxID=1750599 RepID=A0A2T0WEL2_9BACT|nr:hypothetical protein CLW00_11461 [Mongoliibacter ruber]
MVKSMFYFFGGFLRERMKDEGERIKGWWFVEFWSFDLRSTDYDLVFWKAGLRGFSW